VRRRGLESTKAGGTQRTKGPRAGGKGSREPWGREGAETRLSGIPGPGTRDVGPERTRIPRLAEMNRLKGRSEGLGPERFGNWGFWDLGDPEVDPSASSSPPCVAPARMIEVVCNDRLGKKVRVKCKYPLTAERHWSLGMLCMRQESRRCWRVVLLKRGRGDGWGPGRV
jgi:hypothetical protein